ncbi:MAG TPA: PQQ-dependent sugar dehydrogenase [bacterium]|nr:PQQ-dependent sugar dehydrogenase [bacterium]
MIVLFSLLLAGCGGTVESTSEPIPLDQVDNESLIEPSPTQPFIFEPVGDFIQGIMPIDIEALPSGNFLIATRDGQIILLDSDLQALGHAQIPATTFWDAGLVSVVHSNGRIYAALTLPESACPSSEAFCNGIVRYDLDETADNPLSNPQEVFNVSMVDRQGQHNGGALIFDDNGDLILGVGDGFFPESAEEAEAHSDLAQDDSSFLGKLIKVDPEGIDAPAIVAKGLRNPFTASRIPGLGMVVGDVGFETYEELNLYPFGGPYLNFGWPLEEGPKAGSLFSQPIGGFDHCDPTNQDADPSGHDASKSIAVKRHAGVVHECGSEIITAAGFYEGQEPDPYGGQLDRTLIYAAAYYGYIRGITIDDQGVPSNDRHLAHFPGVTSFTVGQDGHLYGVSIFASNQVLKMIPNPEHEESDLP